MTSCWARVRRRAAFVVALGLSAAAQAAPRPADTQVVVSPRPPPRGRPVVVAIVDDAFRLDRTDLADLWWANPGEVPGNGQDDDHNGRVDDVVGWDAADGDGSVVPPADRLAEFRHGTYLAGIVAAGVRAQYGDAAPDAVRLLPVKALEDRSDRPYLIPGFAGLAYALDAGADIVLCAWGSGTLRDGERALLDRARAEGVLVIAAAGNTGDDSPQYPAAYGAVLSVAAVDAVAGRLGRSSFGGTVDLSAPGDAIEGADVASADGLRVDSGTSPAAALVAAAAAIVWRQHPSWTATEVQAALVDSAAPVSTGDARYAASLGAGALDLETALSRSPWDRRALWSAPAGAIPLRRDRSEGTSFSVSVPGLPRAVHLSLDPVRTTPRALTEAHLAVYAGRTARDPLAWEGTLDTFPAELLVPSGRLYVRWQPGRRDLAAFLRYHADPIDPSARWCADTVTLNAPGLLEDGSGDAAYAAATDCKWLITAPEGQVVRFVFDQLDTEAGVDQVLFFLGPSTAGPMMAGFSGTSLPPELRTWGRQVLVWFVANDSVEGRGWRARYDFVPAP